LITLQEESQPPISQPSLAQNNQARNRKLARFGLVFAFLGLLLFAYFVRKAGVNQIVEGIKRLGFGFLLILGISAIRQVVRSLAWTKCFEAPYFIRFREAFTARVMGDALGNIVPLASVAVSEPSKAAFVEPERRINLQHTGRPVVDNPGFRDVFSSCRNTQSTHARRPHLWVLRAERAVQFFRDSCERLPDHIYVPCLEVVPSGFVC
jgi:hypothetical protein